MIEGLRLQVNQTEKLRRRDFGQVPPYYVVFHGGEDFAHEHYGVHIGQEDHLTFLGDASKVFWGDFLDCRANSLTHGVRQTLQLTCDIESTLIIPAGVAHAFREMEGVFTINNYVLYLPPAHELLNANGDWRIEHDVINLPFNCLEGRIPRYRANSEMASNLFYAILASSHIDKIGSTQKAYPIIQDVETKDRGTVRLKFLPKDLNFSSDEEGAWGLLQKSFNSIKWKPQLTIRSGIGSGIYVNPKFGELSIIESPFNSLRSIIELDCSFEITFVSSSIIELIVRDGDLSNMVRIPGDGAFTASVEGQCDFSVYHRGAIAIVHFNESRSKTGLEQPHEINNKSETRRRQKLSATPDLSGTVLPLCLIPNSALKSAPPFNSVKPKASVCAALLA